jgi:hypothetical protein
VRRSPPFLIACVLAAACSFDKAYRWDDSRGATADCTPGAQRCNGALQLCVRTSSAAPEWTTIDDCPARNLVCAATLQRCASCEPGRRKCEGLDVVQCSGDGAQFQVAESCDANAGKACRDNACIDLCGRASAMRSNMGCEYWAADLDNAVPDPSDAAAAQQYAIVVSNPQPDVRAHVTVEQDDGLPGEAAQVSEIASADVLPMSLHVFKLGPREIDGSPEGEFDAGTGTALTRHAFRVRSSVPVVAYQFNPLENAKVFSNDASLLKPVEALADNPGTLQTHYVVIGWPQTIAVTDNPDTNWGSVDLRAFVAVIGTRADTHVRFTTTTRIIPGDLVTETAEGGVLDLVLQPFDVLNLESGGFMADFTGSLIEADQPVVVFTGSEASDAPLYEKLADRRCCADHLEEQLDPIRTAGYKFVVPHAPSVSKALSEAGGAVVAVPSPEFTRVMAVSNDGPTLVTTTLPPPDDAFTLEARGDFRQLTSWHPFDNRASGDFTIVANQPISVATVQASQQAAGIDLGQPGGDPSLVIVPPLEQYRTTFVFLTPDKYAFDFISIAAPAGAGIQFDGAPLDVLGCERSPGDGLSPEQRGAAEPAYEVHRCQLSYPIVDPFGPDYENISPGKQNDGVHTVQSDRPIMVIAYGFDNRVSYGYATGTQLETVLPPR